MLNVNFSRIDITNKNLFGFKILCLKVRYSKQLSLNQEFLKLIVNQNLNCF